MASGFLFVKNTKKDSVLNFKVQCLSSFVGRFSALFR